MNRKTLAAAVALVLLGLGGAAWWLLSAGSPAEVPGGTPAPAEAAAPRAAPAPARPGPPAGRAWTLRGTGSVEGILREYGTDRPLGGVKVILSAGVPGPGQTVESTTLPDGSFLLPRVPNFEAWLLTARVGAPLAELEVAGVEVIESRVTDLGVLYATPGFAVPGIVVDGAGAAVPGAAVRAVRTRPPGVRMDFLRIIRELPRQSPAVDAAVTDAAGRFVLRRLAPGTYDFEVSAKDFRLAVERGVIVNPESGSREIRIVLSRGYALRGRVVRRTEGAIEGLRVVGIPQPANDRDMFETLEKSLAVTDAAGEFTLEGLGPGTHAVGVEVENEPYHLAVDVEIPRDGWLEIVLEGDAWLEGSVKDQAGDPVPAAQVYVANFRSGAPLVGFAVTDGQGRYRINSLKSGPVQLFMVQAEGFGTYPEDFLTVLRGSGGDLILKPGKNEKDVVLGKGGIVRGTVVEAGTESPVEGVRVSLASLASFFGGQRTGTTDAAGRFEITSVPVGGAVLVASKDGWVQPGLTPQSMAGMAMQLFAGGGGADPGQGLTVVISRPGEVVERTLEMSRGTAIRGTVLSPAGTPVAGARVSVEFASPQGGFMRQLSSFFPLGEARLSGPEGTFEIPAPPAGQKVAVTARAQGYLDGRSEDLETRAEGDLEGVTVRLREGATLEGRVTGPGGRPVDGAVVRWTPVEEGQDGGRRFRLQSAKPSRTDGEGNYRIPNVEGRKLVVQFSHPSYLSVSREGVEAAEGKTVEVSAELAPALAVTGRVAGPDGRAFSGARVDVARIDPMPAGGDPNFQVPDNVACAADGSFTVPGLPAGRYRVRAQAEGAADSEPVEAEAGGPAVTLRLAAAFGISGVVRTRQGAVLSNVRVRAQREGGGGGESANTNRDGRFEIRDLPAGTYEVRAEAGWGVGSSRPNLVPAAVSGVQAGTQDLLIEVEEGLRIAGTVVRADGSPVAEGWVNASQILKPGEKGSPATANGPILDGKFELAGLLPGRYRVGVGGNDLPWKQVEAEAGGESVRIQYGQGGAIEGRVVGPDGTPAAGVWVGAQGAEGNSGAPTGPDGRFAIRELPAGTYTVAAAADIDGRAHRGSAAGVSVANGAATGGVEILLQPAD